MKNTHILSSALAGSFLLASANAEISVADDLSIYGYIDMAATYTDGDDTSPVNSDGVDTFDASVAEVELGFAFNPEGSPWSAVAELSFKPSSDVDFETVTITYAFNDQLSVSAGNILSYQGLETFDATGLYQFSYAGALGAPLYSAGYAVGASIDYFTDDYGAGVWIGESDKGEAVSVEALVQYTGVEGLTLKAIIASDPLYDTVNLWGTYEVGDFTFGAEYVNTDYDSGVETDAYVGLVNYAFGDAAVTFRYSGGTFNDQDFDRYTISPSYAFSDNVFGLLEYTVEDIEGVESSLLAAEMIFSF